MPLQVVSTKTIVYRISKVVFEPSTASTPTPPPGYFEIAIGFLDVEGVFRKLSSKEVNVDPAVVATIMAGTPAALVPRMTDINTVWYQHFLDTGDIEGAIQVF
jgi:hypothetical protein